MQPAMSGDARRELEAVQRENAELRRENQRLREERDEEFREHNKLQEAVREAARHLGYYPPAP